MPERCGYDFKCINFKHNCETDILSIQANIIQVRMLEDLIGGESTLV